MDLTGRVRRWNRGGFIILFFVGTLWHFLFNLSGHFPLVGAFAPVNESIWEHGKILLWPITLWWLLGMALIRPMRAAWPQGDVDVERRQARWLLGACTAALTALTVMIAGYYTYTGALGLHALWADILLFTISLGAGQAVGLRVFARGTRRRSVRVWTATLLVVLLILSVGFPFCTPRRPLFQ